MGQEHIRIIAWPAFKNRVINPYNWLLYSALGREGVAVDEFSVSRLLRGRYSIWHVHWPERFFNLPSRTTALLKSWALLRLVHAARARGIRIVWTAHNLHSHEYLHPDLEGRFWEQFTRQVDGFICLSEEATSLVRSTFPALSGRRGYVVPHGHYRDAYPAPPSREECRARLGLPLGPVLLFFGQMRPYKGVLDLVNAFRELRAAAATLLVVGRPSDPDFTRDLLRLAGADTRIRLTLEFVPEDQVPWYFGAADLVVLPYREILNSASALLALSFNRPVYVPSMGALGELRSKVGPEWVMTFKGPLRADGLEEAVDWAVAGARSTVAPLDEYDWGRIAKLTRDAYESICRGV